MTGPNRPSARIGRLSRRQWLTLAAGSVASTGLSTDVLAAPASAPVVAVPYYNTAVLLQMQRRHHSLPAARRLIHSADVLRTTLSDACPAPDRLAARRAWAETRAAWTRLSAVATGPLLQRRSGRAIDFQPTRPGMVLQGIASLQKLSGGGTDARNIERIGTPAKGLPALEWLLWSPEAPSDAAACAYAVALAEELVREAQALEADWLAEDAIAEPDEAQQTAAFAEFINQWLGAVETLRWADIERPMRAGRHDKLGWPRQRSGQTALAWRSHWDTLRTLTLTPDGPPPAIGAGLVPMALYLRGHGHLRLAAALDLATRQADAALRGLGPSSGSGALRTATRALTRLKTLIEHDAASAARVNIGFTDSDGD